MSKKNKKPGVATKPANITPAPAVDTTATDAPAAPVVEPATKAPKKETKKPVAPATKVDVIQIGEFTEMATKYNSRQQGLDANHQIDMLTGLRVMLHDDPDASRKYGIPENSINAINKVVVNGFMVAMIDEIQFGKSPFAMRMNVSQLEAIKEFAPMIGVSINDLNLPAPAEDGMVELESKNVIISEETKAAVKAEKDIIAKKPTTNPSEIENDAQLKDALTFILSDDKSTPQIYDRIEKSVSFYKSYLQIVAKKAKDDAKYKEVENTSRADLLLAISKICHDVPFSTKGLAKYMLIATKNQESPLKAFLNLKSAAINSDTKVKPSDQLLADTAKVLILWSAQSDIEKLNDNIKESNKNITILKKDEKKNEKAIKLENEKIVVYNTDIDELNAIGGIISNPSTDLVKEVESILTGEKPADRIMSSLVKGITDIYYPNADKSDPKNVAILNNNIVQMAGIIINLFRDPNANNIAYTIGNLKEVKDVVVEKPAKEEPTETKEDATKK